MASTLIGTKLNRPRLLARPCVDRTTGGGVRVVGRVRQLGSLVLALRCQRIERRDVLGWRELPAVADGGPAGFIAGFAGDDRNIVDYLVDEVLSRQSDEVRRFLMRASVLDPLKGDLCDAALEQVGSQTMIESLERANLFLVPLDGQRNWYRFHRLFADVLRRSRTGSHPSARNHVEPTCSVA